ncbi:hypothetical protein [Rheinheimera sp.]|uniref:hypothetical protein n=1 Tax=Rheinheimera sp. TaxID=1869214 RepID=UPI00307E5011
MLMQNWLSRPLYFVEKGRLAGFFLCSLLCACQPDWSAKTDTELFKAAATEAAAATELAQRRLAQQQWTAALKWQLQALQLGEHQLLAPYLHLLEQQQGFYAAAEFLSLWQQAQHSQVEPSLLAQYGLWQGNSSVPGLQRSECALQLQPVLQNAAAEQQWKRLLAEWQRDPAMSSLSVCFLPAQRIQSLELRCSLVPDTRVQCQYQHLASLVRHSAMTQLLVIGGKGGASYNNGILQLAEDSPYSVLRHEFAHVLGFIDEYLLPESTAKDLCTRSDIPNLLTDLGELPLHQRRFAHQRTVEQLVKVDTCAQVGLQAYALSDWSLMRYHEAELSPLYLHLMQNQLKSAKALMPVQYFYAYKARLAGDMTSWSVFMRKAAALGYPDAIRLLQQSSKVQTDQPAPD